MTPLHQLSAEVQAAIDRQVARIKLEFDIKSELLSLEELASVIGKQVNYLWNLRNSGRMLPIPVTKVGGHDTYWIVHVVIWLMKFDESAVGEAEPMVYRPQPSERKPENPLLSIGQPKAKEKGRRSETNAAKEALLARGMKILAQRQAESRGR